MTEKLSAFDLETFMSKLVDALPKLAGASPSLPAAYRYSSTSLLKAATSSNLRT